MNFCILNFRKSRFAQALAVTVALTAIVDLAVAISVRLRTSSVRFIDNKESKFRHLSLQQFATRPDIVFVGSSYTKNHISTSALRESGMNVYNLGISGRLLADFPSMVEAALTSKPKLIVLNLSAIELTENPHTDFPHWADVRSTFSSSRSFGNVLSTFGVFLLGMHKLHYYREPIYEQGRSVLKRILAPLVRGSRATQAEAARDPMIAQQERAGVDCEVFKTTHYPEMTVVTCTNGDGAQLGQMKREKVRAEKRIETAAWNAESIRLLNEVIRSAKDKTKVLVLLQPDSEQQIEFDNFALQAQIEAPILNLSNSVFTDGDWCDAGHFNVYGRKKFSALLATRLPEFLNPRISLR